MRSKTVKFLKEIGRTYPFNPEHYSGWKREVCSLDSFAPRVEQET
jgi:hypothetical protein